jgi:hypothetical protein
LAGVGVEEHQHVVLDPDRHTAAMKSKCRRRGRFPSVTTVIRVQVAIGARFIVRTRRVPDGNMRCYFKRSRGDS